MRLWLAFSLVLKIRESSDKKYAYGIGNPVLRFN